MHEWVHSFKASQEETIKTDYTGSLKDSWPGFCVTNYADMSVPTHNNAQKEVEVGTLKDTLSAPAQNGEDGTYWKICSFHGLVCSKIYDIVILSFFL